MAVTTTTSRVSYVGDGTTTVFAVPFYFLIDPDLNVYIGDTELTTGYTVAGAGNEAGGSVEIIPAPAAGAQVVIVRNPDPLQQTRLPPNDPFPAQAVEDMADKLTMLVQRNGDLIGRALVLADTDVDGSGAYRAKQNRIQDLADPVGSQDAVNLRTMQTAIADLVTTGGGDTVLSLLANNVDPTLGASLVGLIGPDGSPRKVSDLSNGSSTALGDALIPVKQMFVGAIMRTQHDVNAQRISILDFGAKTDGTDCATAFAAAVAAVNLLTIKPALIFPAGVYTYSASPNWALDHLRVIPEGEVRLRYTGTDHAVIIDAGPLSSDSVYDVSFGAPNLPFIIEAPATAKNACYLRGWHHSYINVKPRGAGSTYAGVRLDFGVCSTIDMSCSVNEDGGWYSPGGVSAKPAVGLILDQRNAGELTSYCTVNRPVLEGLSTGTQFIGSQGNYVLGGTMEGCVVGADFVAGATHNRVVGTDFEANSSVDIRIQGPSNSNEFINVDTATLVYVVSGNSNRFIGGLHQTIRVDAGINFFQGVTFNKDGGGSFTDNPGAQKITDVFDAANGRFLMNRGGYVPLPAAGVSVGASPFLYTNTNPYPVDLQINGGTVSQITRLRGALELVFASATNTAIHLEPGDASRISYSSAPTLNVFPKK